MLDSGLPASGCSLGRGIQVGNSACTVVGPLSERCLEALPGFDLQRAAEELASHLNLAWFAADVLPSNGCCLDVLPKEVNKGTAIEYLESCTQLPSPK